MVKVLTIRDPKTGALIAEEQIQPKEDKDAALARIYRKTLGPDAPELKVITKSIWLDDREWAAELARDWGGFGLAFLGPQGDPTLEKSRLVLARVSESLPGSRMEFPVEKGQLDAIKHGRRRDAVVPVSPEDPPAVGDTVTFLEATSDPFGTPVLVPSGNAVSVALTEVRNQGHKWVGRDLYYIAWDPAQTKKGPKSRNTQVNVKRSLMDRKAAAGAVARSRELHGRLSRYGKDWIFRGHADARWELIPKAGREPYTGHEETLFESWKRRAVEHLASNFTSDWDWLAIAQHHGLATRLLDWTTNPLNAAYFAVRESREGPAVIHAAKFEAPFKKSAETLFKEPLKCDSVAIFRPRGVVPRIVRQGGLFTIHGPPEKSLESLTRERIVVLKQIVVAESYRPKLLAELARYGINSASLFPDLDGLSAYLNWTVESGELLD